MNTRNRRLIGILSTGILTTFLTLVALFWARWYCHLVRVVALYQGMGRVQVSPTGLFPDERADDPNLASPSLAAAQLSAVTGLFAELGAPQYVLSYTHPGPDSYIYRWLPKEEGPKLYYDPTLHLMVHAEMSDAADPNGEVRRRYVTRFAGPEGVAEAPEERLGRFVSPISDGFYANNPQTVYDEGYQRFFTIRWRDGLVRKGPELTQENGYHPVQMGLPQKGSVFMSMTARDALYRQPGRTELQPGKPGRAFRPRRFEMDSLPVLVLHESGRIDLLNPDTLALTPGVGRLPTPPTLFRNSGPVGPADVAAYCVYPVADYPRGAERKWAYVGCLAATASYDLTGVELEVFDPNGRSVASKAMDPSPDEAYFSLSGASMITVAQFVVENLHPLASLLLSSLTASQVPATCAYRSLVVLPNSFAAMAARDAGMGRFSRFASSMLFMIPAIVLGVFLAWRVSRDAACMGLSRQESTLWILGVFLLGLPVFLTYRLTRPKVALITCGSCGLGRRADFGKCQRCGASWVVPELTPPSWRVLGEPEQAEEASSSPAQEMGSPAKDV